MKHTTKTIKLNNGSELLVITSPGPDACFFGSSVRAGSFHAPKQKWELAHLFEHLSFCGNKMHPSKDEFAYELEKFGATSNARTGGNSINFYYETSKDHLFDIIKLAVSQLASPLISEEYFLKEKEVIKRELEPHLDNIYGKCGQNLHQLVHPNQLTIEGRLQTLEGVTHQDVIDFYKKFFHARNTKFLLAGSYNEAEVLKVVKFLEKELANYPKEGEVPSLIFPPLGEFKGKVVAYDEKRAERFCADFVFIGPAFSRDLGANIRVFNTLLNQGHYSRIFRQTRERGISYGVKTGYHISWDFSEFWFYDTSNLKNSLEIFELCLSEITGVLAGSFSDKELERARGFVKGGLERDKKTALDLVSWYGSDFAESQKLVDFNGYLKDVDNVTRESLIKAANQLIKKESWALSLLGPEAEKHKKEYEKIIKKYLA